MNSVPGMQAELREDELKEAASQEASGQASPAPRPRSSHTPTRQRPQLTQVFLTTLWPHGGGGWMWGVEGHRGSRGQCSAWGGGSGQEGHSERQGASQWAGQACTPAPVGCPALALTLGASFPEASKSQPCSPCLHTWPHPPTPAPTCQPRASGLSLGRPQLLGAGRELSASPGHSPGSPEQLSARLRAPREPLTFSPSPRPQQGTWPSKKPPQGPGRRPVII